LKVEAVNLRHFRNYERLELSLDEGFHVVAGPNAQGKTNFLEALYLLSSTRLLRGSRDGDAIFEGESRATLNAQVGPTTVGLVLEAGTRKRAFLNGLGLPRAADLIGRLPCVCVSSLDLPIVRGEPSDRRLFMDLELSQVSASYLRHFTMYKRALEQRNALLKQAQESFVAAESFEPWELPLGHHGAALRALRREFIRDLEAHASAIHGLLGDGELLQLRYEPNDPAETEAEMIAQLAEKRNVDIHRKSTTLGPHRDELKIVVEGREARVFGSQGQQRSALLALKLATLLLLKDRLGETPLLLMDDILSDLDESRRGHLTQWVVDHAAQAVLTCTEVSAVGAAVTDRARILTVKGGVISG
jgi:DNA replication and repair protein RecF